MTERFRPKEITQDPDVQIVGGFGGLSSASYQATGEVAYADKLVNGYVTSRNEITIRKGSRVAAWLGSMTEARAASLSNYTFTFDSVNYMVVKSGRSILLFTFDSSWQYLSVQQRSNIFYSRSDTEEANISTVIENDCCYVLMATKYTPLMVLTIFKRDMVVATVPTSTSLTGNISRYPYTNSINQNNVSLFDESGAYVRVNTVSQSNFTLSIATSATHTIAVNSTVKVHFWYYCYGTSANYYPGSYLYNASVRRNSIPLDVNVAIPQQIYSNPLLYEPQIQDLSAFVTTTEVWKDQSTPTYTRNTSGSPSTATTWDYSDGNYLYGGSTATQTTRSPYFVSFGALTAGGASETVFFYRWREILVCKNTSIADADLLMFHDKVPVTGRYMRADGTSSVAGQAKYFAVTAASRPALSAVVELFYGVNRSIPTVVDLSINNTTITILDGCIFPIYGYSDIADIRTDTYPNQVITVGNRVVFSGYSNRVTMSNADWNYRGITWNNLQVSEIDFNVNSAYTVSIGQQSSIIIGTTSVNGVLIVATDTGIYRISGSTANAPPNATAANVSRVSNELIANAKCLLIYENRVFFVSSRGLYQLQYQDTTEEINITPLSTQVSDFFAKVPICLNYSAVHRAFMIYFRDTTEVLVYNFNSETFSTFKFGFAPVNFSFSQSIDGFVCSFTDASLVAPHWVFWDNSSTTDLSNALLPISPYTASLGVRPSCTLLASSVSVSSTPTLVDSIVPPVDFVSLLSPLLSTAYGSNHAVSSSPPTTVSYPTTGGIRTYPIECFFVSKAFSSDKLIRANRVRAINLLLTGAGTANTAITLVNKTPTFDTTVVNSSGSVQENTSETTRVVAGDLVNIRLRLFGVSEYWAIAVKLTDSLKLLGYQVDSSTKKKGRLS